MDFKSNETHIDNTTAVLFFFIKDRLWDFCIGVGVGVFFDRCNRWFLLFVDAVSGLHLLLFVKVIVWGLKLKLFFDLKLKLLFGSVYQSFGVVVVHETF